MVWIELTPEQIIELNEEFPDELELTPGDRTTFESKTSELTIHQGIFSQVVKVSCSVSDMINHWII
jgi:hypothetical protein